jgi:RNA polymerase sigma-70 factor (ECF subfamily)
MTTTAPTSPGADRAVIAALRAGDEDAFAALVDANHGVMLRVAMHHVSSRAVAEEVVQEAWLGILRGLDRFEERASLRTWMLRIVANLAKSRGIRERRVVPFSSLASDDDDAPTVDPSRFEDASHPQWPGHWASPPNPWDASVERLLLGREAQELIAGVIAELPERQRRVIELRDVEGFSSEEVCELLGVSEGNQRVLLHRARARVRNALESYVDG